MPHRPLELGAHFSFKLTGDRGAALVTKYPTFRKDSLLESAFERYTKRHYESWVAFARQKEYGDNVQPVLVYGFDTTRDFAMVAYSNEGASLESDFTVTVPMIASASVSIWGTWHTRCSPHTNYGPQQWGLPPLERAINPPSPQPTHTENIPDEFDQCVFVRYYTMRRRRFMFPKVIRAGAGPHDLGPGDSEGDTFPELMVQSGVEPTTSGDEDFTGQCGPATNDANYDPDAVVRNIPSVRVTMAFCSFSDLCLQDEEYDSWDVITDYVFQVTPFPIFPEVTQPLHWKNSDAVSVLMCHRDLAGIRTVRWVNISVLSTQFGKGGRHERFTHIIS